VLTPFFASSLYSYIDTTKKSIYFGSYPQKKVSDANIISHLNTLAWKLPTSTNSYKWSDYGYYMSGSISSYMYYIDIDLDDDETYDYRGVYFTSYRPFKTSDTSICAKGYQEANGYYQNKVYWFKYEPIKWNILKTETNKALIISDLVLDSQDYNYTTSSRSGATDYQGNSTTDNVYANNYMYSHIRSWLNQTFYDTAFNTLEKEIIEITEVDNSVTSTDSSNNLYVCSNTFDYIFLLSSGEANTYYPYIRTMFSDGPSRRRAQSTDYAKSQGEIGPNTTAYYWLRLKSYYSSSLTSYYDRNTLYVSYISANGDIYGDYQSAVDRLYGVRPVCWINL
jgi:hypothetical protein